MNHLTWAWPETPLVLLAIIVLALVGRWLLVRAVKAGVNGSLNRARRRNARQGTRAERILAEAAGVNSARHEARTRTIGSLLRSSASLIVVTVAALTMLDYLGVPLGPVLASAGIGGLALGFGAQSLIKDTISGIFLIMEDQFGVGDVIDTGEVTGVVDEVGLRVTRLRDASGQIWYVRNGEIVRVGNRSQGWATASVDLPVALDEDGPRAVALLKEAMDAVYADATWEKVLLQRPEVVVDRVTAVAMTIKIFARCTPDEQVPLQRDLLVSAQQALRAAGIRGPAGAIAGE